MTESEIDRTGTIGGTSSPRPRVSNRVDRWMFTGLCGYLLAQVFTIPVITVGPWALWPTISDLLFIALLMMAVVSRTRLGTLSDLNQGVARGLRLLALVSFAAFGISLVRHADGGLDTLRAGNAISFGAYFLAKLLQFMVLFWLVASLQMSRSRLAILRTITVCVLTAVCIMSLVTFSGIVSTASLAPWLPSDPETAGPWTHYRTGVLTGEGVGTISYNHGYTALHVTVLLGLALQLAPWSRANPGWLGATNYGLIGLSAIAILVSGSRAGLMGFAVLATFYLLSRPRLERTLVVGVGLIGAFLVDLALFVLEVTGYRVDIVDRQLGVLSVNSLATRTDLWDVILNHLNSYPVRWVVGSGLGAAAEVGNYAHMLPLQLILDFGLIGLVVFGVAIMRLLGRLRRTSITGAAMFWLTVALLVTSLTQETFYPVPAFGNLLGLYLAAVALTLTAERVAAAEFTDQQVLVSGSARDPESAAPGTSSRATGSDQHAWRHRGPGGLADAT